MMGSRGMAMLEAAVKKGNVHDIVVGDELDKTKRLERKLQGKATIDNNL